MTGAYGTRDGAHARGSAIRSDGQTCAVRGQLRIGSRLSWAVAWSLALGASVVYLLWPDDLTWLLAPLLLVPLVALIVWRYEQHDDIAGGPPPNADGPWAPPGDGGGGG